MRAVIDRGLRPAERRPVGERLHARSADPRRTLPRRAASGASQRGQTLVWAKQTILCTGGTGQIYRETTNPEVATGDGLAIAYRAGAELRDMEFMQFHPTVLYIAGSSRSLITEAMRGEGARLVDRDGHAFMPDYDPRGELAPRDVVSRAIVTQMERTQHPSVYLDLTHLDAGNVRARFPGIAATCAEFGLDITRDWIPVRPGCPLHDRRRDGRPCRAARRCPACGRPANARPADCTGRIAWRRTACWKGWSLAPMPATRRLARRPRCDDDFRALPLANPPLDAGGELLDLADIRNSLKSLIWRAVGVRRERQRLVEAARQRRSLVRLRAGPAIQRRQRLGAAKHAHRGSRHDRGGHRARGDPGGSLSDRFPRVGRCPLEATNCVSPGWLSPSGRDCRWGAQATRAVESAPAPHPGRLGRGFFAAGADPNLPRLRSLDREATFVVPSRSLCRAVSPPGRAER